MSWYNNEPQLDYSKPIMATLTGGDICILLPQIAENRYTITGYNWFNIYKGEYNSCSCFYSPQEAVLYYRKYNPKNCELIVQ